MKYHVMFSPEAMEQLADLYQYIAFEASPEIALGTPKPSSIIVKASAYFLFVARPVMMSVPDGVSLITKNVLSLRLQLKKVLFRTSVFFMLGKTVNRVYLKIQATTRRIEILKGTIYPCPNPNTPHPRSKLLAINSTCAPGSRWSC